MAQTLVRHTVATLALTVAGGEIIETTAEHPFYVEGQGFVPAGELGIGTSIVTRAGPSLRLQATASHRHQSTVYNLEVEGFHTYFVGNSVQNAVWVHNVDCPPGYKSSMLPPGVDEAHYIELGFDPATGRFRQNEADTALRLEQELGTDLSRYDPNPAIPDDKGDWIDVDGNVYDSCSPPASPYFNQQLVNGNYQTSLLDHLNNPNVDDVVIDITNLGLTQAQVTDLENLINGLSEGLCCMNSHGCGRGVSLDV